MHTIAELQTIIGRFLPRGVVIDGDTPLLSSGLVGSLQVTELVVELQAQCHVRIDLADIGADNFDTLRQMADYLQHHA